MCQCRGTEEYYGLDGKIDIINSTLGKALGGAAGGYTTGPKELIDLLRQRSRPYLFSNSLPPPVVACASKVSLLTEPTITICCWTDIMSVRTKLILTLNGRSDTTGISKT